MTRCRPLIVAVVTMLCWAQACSSDDADTADPSRSESTAEARPTVERVLADAGRAMATVESVRFTIEQTGAEVFIDSDEIVRFSGASGRFAAPSSSEALIEVQALGLDAKVGAVAIDGELLITNPLTGTWEKAPDDLSFDPAKLFDPDVGWSAVLTDGLEDPQLVSDRLDSDGRYQVRGTIAAERVSILTGGLVDEESEIDIWIDGDSHRVLEAAFDVATSEGPTSWRLVLSDYGAAVKITRPEIGSRG